MSEAVLDDAIEQIADGLSVDWRAFDAPAPGRAREWARSLRVLNDIVKLHREAAAEYDQTILATMPASETAAVAEPQTWGKYRLANKERPGPAHPAPLADAQRALRLVRFKAKDYGIDPKRDRCAGAQRGIARELCDECRIRSRRCLSSRDDVANPPAVVESAPGTVDPNVHQRLAAEPLDERDFSMKRVRRLALPGASRPRLRARCAR